MNANRHPIGTVLCILFILAAALSVRADMLWTCGLNDGGWPMGTGGGANASFVQENGSVNPLPGSAFSTSEPRGADNDYYFAGNYTTVIAGNGTYDPIGLVDVDEEAAERAFTDGDIEQRYHFNLPSTLKPTDLLSVTYDINNLRDDALDPHFGVEVYVNGKKVQNEIVIRAAQLLKDYTTPQFSLADVGAEAGPGFDNIVTLKGISYSAEGGGDWMGIDHVQLNQETVRIPTPVLPWQVGLADNAWATGTGGGSNTTFVAGNGSVNALPGSPTSTDNDYYLGGLYTNVIAANGTYTPVGTVLNNEQTAEGGFAGAENELRYHFNLPNTLQPGDYIAVSFGALNLDTNVASPSYGVEVWVNGVRVQPEVLITPAQLNKPIKTDRFTLASVNAGAGLGYDNILTLRGISHKTEGGGDSLGLDYVALVAAPIIPAPTMPWAVGRDDNAQPRNGTGGGPNANFVQENGTINPLPGIPNSPVTDKQADNDYYLAGSYNTVIAANGNYTPVGDVPKNEEAAERAFAAADNELRYHFNLPSTLSSTDLVTVTYDALSLDTSGADPRYGVEVYFNSVLVQTQMVIRADQLNQKINTPPFTLGQVNAQLGPGYDNIVSLKGINYNADGGGNWMGFDYIELNPVGPTPFPVTIGKDDNAWPAGFGGGANATFVQEAGSNVLPGNPASPQVDGQADDDYYLAGIYTNTIPSVIAVEGDYAPVGTVLVNEEAAERAFAGSDNTKRYHFNLPNTLKPTDQLLVSFDFNNLDTSGTDPQYGFEVYFNDVKLQDEVIVRNAELDYDYVIPVTLASVNAQTGPGWDNIVRLQGINHSADGGGAWMGIDYIQVDPLPQPVFPWAVGMADNGWPTGTGGGPNTSFVQENGTVNDLPGNAHNHPMNRQADNDYYFAGVYTNVIAANGTYVPVGYVPRNEEAAERAFAGADNDLRYHFNLPSTLSLANQVVVTFGILNLEAIGDEPDVTDPHYGVEVYFNNTKVQSEIIVRTNDLGTAKTTAPFTLASVNAQLGLGPDNIVSLRGVNYDAEGGGNWMGFDYIQLNPAAQAPLKFLDTKIANGKLTLTWTGTANLEWAPGLTGTWTPITPSPTSPYTEDMLPGQTRFYRLHKP